MLVVESREQGYNYNIISVMLQVHTYQWHYLAITAGSKLHSITLFLLYTQT